MNSTFQISKPLPQDIDQLNTIAWEAKKYWDYPNEWMELWKNDLRIDPTYLADHTVLSLDINGKICAWGSLEFDTAESRWEIGHLWVLPEVMGQGIGKMLLNSLYQEAKKEGADEVYILSDPHAKPFYEKIGAHYVKEIPSTPEGRTLPLMKMVWE